MIPRAIFFDMDGTLTEPMLDFPRIRAEMRVAPGQPLLEAMAKMDAAQLAAAQVVLARHEDLAAQQSALNPGCRELLDWLASRRIPTAMITRNSRRSAEIVCNRHGISFDVRFCREDEPYKPHPEPLRRACRKFEIAVHEAWMVGDGIHDVDAGNAASVPTVWLSHGKSRPFSAEPWKTVVTLHELLEVLQGGEV